LLAAADHPAQAERLEAEGIDVAVYIPSGAAALGDKLPAAQGRVRQVHFVSGGTIQELLPAVTLLVTRAGGGTVNDAVACRVPFVCVREPTQRQVAAILAACERQGLTRPIDYDDFLGDPIGTIVRELAQTEANAAISARAQTIPAHGEQTLAEAIAALL
jgi:UDP-N-acetylglucosamine:LPS N-acetylglucosamine transferase